MPCAMVVRWVVAALGDAKKCFRRVRGHGQIPLLLAALNDITKNAMDHVSKAA